MSETLRILILEDRPTDAELMLREVRKEGIVFAALRVETEEDFRKQLQEYRPGLILADYSLPTYDGMSALAVAQEECPDVPFILVSGTLGEDIAVESLHHGATDYILKERLSRLGAAVRRALLEVEKRHELRLAEQGLRDSEMRYRRLFESAKDGILILDAETGMVVDVNPFLTRLLGFSHEQFLGKRVWELGFFKDVVANRANFVELQQKEYIRYEDMALETSDGRRIDVEFVSNVYLVNDRKVVQCNIRDITERKRLEAQFLQSQKMETVGQLAGGIAHDFNNLLTVINGMSDLVLAQVSQDDPVHADVQEILHAGQRAATLTRQLLAFSRQQILEPRVLNFNTVVAGTESLLRRLLGEDIDLVVVPTPGVGAVKADPGQLEQVITNLAVNAGDAMPQGGRLTIETQNVEIDEADARRHGVAMPPGSYVRLVVRDSGVGMDEATRARVFEPFFTTKGPGKGTGLGLSTVYGIVTQSHGFVWVESEVGQGTSFKICLPRVTEAAGTGRPAPTVVSTSGTETILLVEDNAGLRKLVTRFLAPAGYTVLAAATGEEALRLLERHDASVHLLLSDVVMPGMSGRDLADRLAPIRPGMKVLYMSGYTSDTIVRHGVLDAQVPFLNKPFTAAALLRKVREVLDA